jgi:hypothetical protein
MLEKWGSTALEIALVAVLTYLVVTNAQGFSQIAASVGNVYASSVRALQGR